MEAKVAESKAAEATSTNFKYLIVFLLFLGWIIGGIDRTVINFAVIPISKELGISQTSVGFIMSAFFGGYMLMQIPGGMLADKFGPRKVLLTIVFVWSVFTAATGLAAGLTSMLAVRFLFGLAEGPFTPSAGKMLGMVFEKNERAKAFSLMLSSSGFVMILAPVFAAYMLTAVGWRNLFYIIGAAGLIIIVLFYFYLKEGRVNAEIRPATSQAVNMPFSKILKIPMIWYLMAANFACYTLIWGLSAWMPTYLIKVFDINIRTAGTLQSIPGFGTLAGLLFSGFIIDRLSDKQNKSFLVVVSAVCTVALYLMYSGTMQVTGVIVTQTVINFITGYIAIYLPSLVIKKLPVEVLGRSGGITLFAAQSGSFFAPFVMGMIADANGGNIGTSFIYIFVMGIVLTLSMIFIKTDTEKHLAAKQL